VNAVAEIGLITGRELRKSFRSVKGIILAVLALLGGVGVTLIGVAISRYADQSAMEKKGIDAEGLKQLKLQLYAEKFGEEQAKFLISVPDILILMFQVMVWLAPLLILLLGFDNLSGELQHRTVRFWTVRSRRWSFYASKVLGLFISNAVVWLVMTLGVGIWAAASGSAGAGAALGWGLRLWLTALPMNLVWAAYATLFSSQFKTPMLSLLGTLGAFFLVWLIYTINAVLVASGKTTFEGFMWLYPNYYDQYLLSPQFGRTMQGLLPCLGLSILFTGLGAWRFARRDV
jgi:ABC-type transport system involved in multi-copper enzyme maturation permease subunit